MQKIIGIVLLTLLLSVNSYANTFYLYCDREIYENNGSGDWSQYYKVGNSPDGSILIKTEEKKSSIKMTVHLAEMDDGNPGKMFSGKGS